MARTTEVYANMHYRYTIGNHSFTAHINLDHGKDDDIETTTDGVADG